MRSRVTTLLAAIACAALLSVGPARADLDAGLAYLHAGEYFEALEELLPLADAGNARAQVEVAAIYHYGLVSGKNFSKASDYYARAAAQENVDGMLGLAVMNALGQGFAKNMIEAYKWLLLARDRLPPGRERDRVAGALDSFREEMTSGEIETAEWRARTWVPDPTANTRN
jgi:TPR repeat protein